METRRWPAGSNGTRPRSPRRRTSRISSGEFIRSSEIGAEHRRMGSRGTVRGTPSIAVLLAALVLALAPAPLLAHAGRPMQPHDLWRAWSLEPGIVAALLASGWMYARGVERVWRRAGVGGGIRRWQAACFAGGWVTLAVAMVSPLHPLGSALFSAHMVQHELLMALAAPLLVLGRPVIPFLFALPIGGRRAAGRWAKAEGVQSAWRGVTGPFAAWLLHAAALWLWHLPGPYQAALRGEGMHTLQHASFLGTGLLFWWTVVHGREGRMGYGASVFYLFATAMHSGALGALLTFAPRPLYPAYEGGAAAWGLTALEDQQLAGLIMWIPAGVSYVVAGLIVLAMWMRESERRAARWQARALLRPA
jgi:putative membrane protein